MLSAKHKRAIMKSEYFITVFEEYSYLDVEGVEAIKFAVKLGKPIYVLKEKGLSVPSYLLEGADVRDVLEFDGPLNSDSYKQAETRLLETISEKEGRTCRSLEIWKREMILKRGFD